MPGLPVRGHGPARGGRPGAFKSTLCYDRLPATGWSPACAKACPTDSIQFGDARRAACPGRSGGSPTLHEAGVAEHHLSLEDEADGIGGAGAFFLLLDEPEVYGLPPDPVSTHPPTCPGCGGAAALAAGTLLAAVATAFVGERR